MLASLGIDLGTTSVKIALVACEESTNERHVTDSADSQYLASSRLCNSSGDGSRASNSNLEMPATSLQFQSSRQFGQHCVIQEASSSKYSGVSEQQPKHIINALMASLEEMTKNFHSRLQLRTLSICGQMHGVILWSRETKIQRNSAGEYELYGTVSNLITWQDQRCSTEFIQGLPKSSGPLAAGYGCATIFWLLKYSPEYLSQFHHAGTIADFIATMLCDLPAVVMSDQNAASWGYYDIPSQSWQDDVLTEAGFPTYLLPTVVPAGTVVGKTSNSVFGVVPDVPVYVPTGDTQCSVISAQFSHHQAVLNLGTSCQMSFLSSDSGCCGENPHLQIWPYKKDKHLCVVASMNGGNALSAFVDMLKGWLQELGVEINEEQIWSRLSTMTSTEDIESHLVIKPTLLKERTTPDSSEGAQVTNILTSNISLGNTYQQLCIGLMQNLYGMLPIRYLSDNSITEILCTGSIFTQHPFMLLAVKQVYKGIDVSMSNTEVNAALGSILMIR